MSKRDAFYASAQSWFQQFRSLLMPCNPSRNRRHSAHFAALAIALPLLGATSCGQPSKSGLRIIGGTAASQDYPFFVSLTAGGAEGRFCGASLIDRRIVLTAAHCVEGQSGVLFVHFAQREAAQDGVDVAARKVVAHEAYDSSKLINDIALIQLAEDAPDFALPITLSDRSSDTVEGDQLRVIGFGNLTSVGWVDAVQLMQVDLNVLSASDCQQPYPSFAGEMQICAGYREGGFDSCQGDSGGPLFRENQSGGANTFQLEGLVSYGNGCAQKDNPGVYTRVSAFRDWIDTTTADFQRAANEAEPETLERLFRQECYSSISLDSEENRNGGVIREQKILTLGGTFKALGNRRYKGTIAETPVCQTLLDDGLRIDFYLAQSRRDARRGVHSVLAFVGGSAKPAFAAPLVSRSGFSLECENGDQSLYWNLEQLFGYAVLEIGTSTYFTTFDSAGDGFKATEQLASCQVGATNIRLEKGTSAQNAETYLVTVSNLRDRRSGIDHRFEYTLSPSDGAAQVGARLETKETGELELVLSNQSQEDMYGWRLTCDAPLALQLSNSDLLESKEVGEGEFELALFDPNVSERAVLAQQSIRPTLINIEQVRAWAKRLNERTIQCNWNSYFVVIDLGLPEEPNPEPQPLR